MNTYIYVLKLINRFEDPNQWTKNDESIIDEHFIRIKNDYEQGKILHVGKTLREDKDGFGIVVFKEENLDLANQYMLDDPAIKHKIMTGNCQAYKIVF